MCLHPLPLKICQRSSATPLASLAIPQIRYKRRNGAQYFGIVTQKLGRGGGDRFRLLLKASACSWQGDLRRCCSVEALDVCVCQFVFLLKMCSATLSSTHPFLASALAALPRMALKASGRGHLHEALQHLQCLLHHYPSGYTTGWHIIKGGGKGSRVLAPVLARI